MILGVRPSVHEVQPHVEEFFFRNRSRSKPAVTRSLAKVCSFLRSVNPQIEFYFILTRKSSIGDMCVISPLYLRLDPGQQAKAQSWALRRLISVFSRTVKRPHVPREPAMRALYLVAGVPLPEGA